MKNISRVLKSIEIPRDFKFISNARSTASFNKRLILRGHDELYMEFPKFLLGDNTDYSDSIFVVHTEFPRFIINLQNDEVEWLEDFDADDEEELAEEVESLIKAANEFYDREVARYDKE